MIEQSVSNTDGGDKIDNVIQGSGKGMVGNGTVEGGMDEMWSASTVKEKSHVSEQQLECNVSKPETPINSNDACNTDNMTTMNKTSYANVTKSNLSYLNNKLCHIPTSISENGIEIVIFDEEIVMEGSKKWEHTPCGYFVGYKMYAQEINYHLFRMWGKYGLKSIQNIGNGTFVFKFKDEQGL